MLNYVKIILTKVSFDKSLFEKELSKAIEKLASNELVELKVWCYSNFSNSYFDILDKFFSNF